MPYGENRSNPRPPCLTASAGGVLRLFLFVLMLFAVLPVSGQQTSRSESAESIVVSNYSKLGMDDGLSSNCVNVIFCDAAGLMWFGSDEGLNAYDGYIVRSFTPVKRDTSTIGGKRVFDICEFEPDKLTVALADFGVNAYDKRLRTFLRPPYSQRSPEDFCSALGLCRVGDYAYVVFPNFVAKRNIRNKQEAPHFIDRPTKQGSAGRVKMKPMPGVGGQVAMLISPHTFGILDTKYENIAEVRFDASKLYDICPLDAEHLLLATADGIYGYDLRSKTFGKIKMLGGQMVQAICRNSDGDFWVAYAGNKIVKWMPSQNKCVPIQGCDGLLTRQSRVNDLFEDGNGLLWVATCNVGVVKIDTKKPKIQTRHIRNDMPANYHTKDMSAAASGDIWAACGESGFARIDVDEAEAYTCPIPGGEAESILARRNGSVFIGTTNGLWRFTPQNEQLMQLPLGLSPTDSLSSVVVRSLEEDCLGNIWISTQDGLYRYNGVSFDKMQLEGDKSYAFNVVTEDSDGRIWAGSCAGLFVRGVGEKTFKRIGRKWMGLDGDGILSFAEYKQYMLVGTSAGIMVYDRRTFELQTMPVFSKFDNRAIYSIVRDRNDVVWLNTSSEIEYVDVNYGNVYSFTHRDGLCNEGNECHHFSVRGDLIYFGQVAAVNYVDTRNVSFNTRMPGTFVSEVIYGSSGGESNMTMINDSTFSQLYVVNASTKIHVASSDYSDPARNHFMYRINNGEWQYLSGTNEILVSGLLPGTYRVMLRSSNADMTWSYDVKTIYIRIESPLWLSRPAILFYAIWFMSIVWLVLNLRFRKINKRMRMAEAEAKSKSIVEDQRNKLVRAINEQHASFNYAKRIQDALMPKVDSFSQYFSKIFVLYKPKEIVSGDFYTFYHRDGKTFVISADCTGHGVPGAFISILGIDHITNIIMRQKVDDAGAILTALQQELSKIGSVDINDGMDMTICVILHNERKINFAGAMNDLYLIRNNEVFVYHGDRMSIGGNVFARPAESQVFNSVMIDAQPGDMLYLFSDGYCDQFGGPEHKKFKVRRFKNLLLNVHKLPANDQRLLLNQKLVEWMGNIEQTDDISIIGFEPWA